MEVTADLSFPASLCRLAGEERERRGQEEAREAGGSSMGMWKGDCVSEGRQSLYTC